MCAEPWGLVHTDHRSSTIRCTPNRYGINMYILGIGIKL